MVRRGHRRFSAALALIAAVAISAPALAIQGTSETETNSKLSGISKWLDENGYDALLGSFLSLQVWQWIGIGAILFIGVVLDFTFRRILTTAWRKLIARRGGQAEKGTLRKTVRPFGLFLAALFWLIALPALDLPDTAGNMLMAAARLFLTLAGVWAAYRLTDLIAEVALSKAAGTETKFDDLLVPLIRKTFKILITIFGVIYIADSMNVQIAPLVAGLGIGGVGFAFAAKDTLENFFGSVTVIADRPFEVGDWVTIGDVEGTVELIGFRSTRVRTFYNSLVTVPNATLVRANVDNFGKRRYRRFRTYLNIAYGTPPDRIESFCEGIRELIRLHPYTRKDYFQVWLHQMGAHSLDILVYMFHEAPDWQTELRERHRFLIDVIRLADRLNVEFAFPTQTLHVFQEEPGQEHTPEPSPTRADQWKSLRAGRYAAADLTADSDWRDGKPPPYHFIHAIPGEGEDGEDDDGTQIESKTGGDA